MGSIQTYRNKHWPMFRYTFLFFLNTENVIRGGWKVQPGSEWPFLNCFRFWGVWVGVDKEYLRNLRNNVPSVLVCKMVNISYSILGLAENFFVSLHTVVQVKLATVVEGNQIASFSIASTLRCRGGRRSFPQIPPLYPWYVPYIAKC